MKKYMKYVEFYKLQADGTQKVVAVCRLGAGGVVCEGDLIFIENLEVNGIKSHKEPRDRKLFPKDGIEFLEQLEHHFTSGYLNASEVKEG